MKKLILVVLLVLGVGCDAATMVDAGPVVDAGMVLDDAEVLDDAGRDSAVADAGADAGAGARDAASDAGLPTPDAGEEDSDVVAADAGTDAGTDAGLDAGVDAGPPPPPPRGAVVQISGAGSRFCGRDATDGVWCWGSPTFSGIEYMGQAVTINGLCGVRPDAVVVCYDTGEEKPIEVVGGLLEADQVASRSTGNSGGCAIDAGTVWCWGEFSTPATQVPGISGATSASSGTRSCASTPSTTYCWGGDLPATPIPIYGPSTTVYSGAFTCISAAGAIYCDGRNNGCEFRSSGPRAAWDTGFVPAGSHSGEFGFGSGHTCSLRADNSVWCIGNTMQGGGRPTACDWYVPYPAGSPVESLAVAAQQNCVILSNGTVECWGSGAPTTIGW